jgi:COP9 signalosome complex subunit 4
VSATLRSDPTANQDLTTITILLLIHSSSAVTASILAPAGPLRSRILATLIRDERISSLPQYTILTKVFLDQIIRPNEIAAFEKLLSPHQRASLPKSSNKALLNAREEDSTMKDGEDEEESERSEPSTVLDRAMMEHNILATSRLYSNITFRGLGGLLDLKSAGAETMVRRMIVQKRLKAEIDQVEGLVIFREEKAREGGVAGTGTADKEGGEANAEEDRNQVDDDPSATFTKRWDASIARTASGVEEICATLRGKNLVSPI